MPETNIINQICDFEMYMFIFIKPVIYNLISHDNRVWAHFVAKDAVV